MHGIARGHFVSTPLEYAFDHEVSSLSYVIWRLFRQHRFGFAASILAWSTWSRRSGLAAIGGTVWYSKVQVRTLSAYSHSFTHVCCRVIPVSSSWVVVLDRLAMESRRVSLRGRLGQSMGQRRKLFGLPRFAVSFLLQGKNETGFAALIR